MKFPDGVVYFYHPKRTSVTVESKELVMCRGCKYSEQTDDEPYLLCHYYGDQWNEDTHWCSYGERRDEC